MSLLIFLFVFTLIRYWSRGDLVTISRPFLNRRKKIREGGIMLFTSWLLFFIFALAAFRLTRLIVYDKITAFCEDHLLMN